MIEKIVIQTVEGKDGNPRSFTVIAFQNGKAFYSKTSGCSDVADFARLMCIAEGFHYTADIAFGTFQNVKTDTYYR